MFAFMTSEAQFCVEEGTLPEEVDTVLEDYGFPLGCFKVGDLSGQGRISHSPQFQPHSETRTRSSLFPYAIVNEM